MPGRNLVTRSTCSWIAAILFSALVIQTGCSKFAPSDFHQILGDVTPGKERVDPNDFFMASDAELALEQLRDSNQLANTATKASVVIPELSEEEFNEMTSLKQPLDGAAEDLEKQQTQPAKNSPIHQVAKRFGAEHNTPAATSQKLKPVDQRYDSGLRKRLGRGNDLESLRQAKPILLKADPNFGKTVAPKNEVVTASEARDQRETQLARNPLTPVMMPAQPLMPQLPPVVTTWESETVQEPAEAIAQETVETAMPEQAMTFAEPSLPKTPMVGYSNDRSNEKSDTMMTELPVPAKLPEMPLPPFAESPKMTSFAETTPNVSAPSTSEPQPVQTVETKQPPTPQEQFEPYEIAQQIAFQMPADFQDPDLMKLPVQSLELPEIKPGNSRVSIVPQETTEPSQLAETDGSDFDPFPFKKFKVVTTPLRFNQGLCSENSQTCDSKTCNCATSESANCQSSKNECLDSGFVNSSEFAIPGELELKKLMTIAPQVPPQKEPEDVEPQTLNFESQNSIAGQSSPIGTTMSAQAEYDRSSEVNETSPADVATTSFLPATSFTPEPNPATPMRQPTLAELQEQLAKMQETAELKLPTAAFCTSVSGYGQYESFQQNQFQAGQRLLIYCEIENFVSIKTTIGNSTTFNTRLRGTYLIKNSDGELVDQKEFPVVEDVASNRRRDFYIHLPVRLRDLAPGAYELQVVMEDLGGNKSAKLAKKLSFTIE